jgi:ubiquinone/menaquinone biosynthesis C-methylase UbiE
MMMPFLICFVGLVILTAAWIHYYQVPLHLFVFASMYVPVTMGFARVLYELGIYDWQCGPGGVDLSFLRSKFKNPDNFAHFLTMGENVGWIREGKLRGGVFRFLTSDFIKGIIPFANVMILRQAYYLKESLVDSDFKAMRELYHSDKNSFYELPSDCPEYKWWNRAINSFTDGKKWFRKKRFPRGAVCLDVCGNHGENAKVYLEAHPGMDLKFRVLDLPHKETDAKEFIAANGLESSIQFIPGNCFAMDLEERFDFVTISYCLEMWTVPDIEKLLHQVARVLKPGGTLYVVVLSTERKLMQRRLSDNFHMTYFLASVMGRTSFSTVDENKATFERVGFETIGLEQIGPSDYAFELRRMLE